MVSVPFFAASRYGKSGGFVILGELYPEWGELEFGNWVVLSGASMRSHPTNSSI